MSGPESGTRPTAAVHSGGPTTAVLPTRGTTASNRLRRIDSWIVDELGGVLRQHDQPLIVDLGFGNDAVTTVELFDRVHRVWPDAQVLGLEADLVRVAAAKSAEVAGLQFLRGDFDLAGTRPVLVRMANVLRQYPEDAVLPAWRVLCAGLAPGGRVIDATTDELGRLNTWVLLDQHGPVSLTVSARLAHLDRPAELAERLVKALIHRNVPGEPIHRFFHDLTAAWDRHAGLIAFGRAQRWQAMCATMAEQWPVLSRKRRHRLGEISVAWQAVAPLPRLP